MDAVLLRAAAYPAALCLPPWPDLDVDEPTNLLAWINQVWCLEGVAQAIAVASPDLAHALTGLHDGTRPLQPQQARRAVEALMRYLLRWTSRATPFGGFAGIAPAGLADHASVRWDGQHTSVERADAAWLADLASELEAQPQVLRCLPVQANNLGFRRGTEWIVPCRPLAEGGFADIAITLSPPLKRALEATRAPIVFAALLDRMSRQYPTASLDTVEAMLTELVALGVLLSGLRPPMTVTDPAPHLTSAISGPATTGSATAAQTLAAAPRRAMDLRLDCAVALPPAVVSAAEQAASLLAALGPDRPVWRAYHAAFVHQYGIGAVVPIQEVTDTDRGLGYPAGYRGSAPHPPARWCDRDLVLARIAQEAALEGRHEVTLQESLLERLAPDPPAVPVPHTELRFLLDAAAPAALDSGDFTLWVAGASRHAGTTAGRFLYLLDESERARFAKAYQDLPVSTAGAVAFQLSCPPLVARTSHLARVPELLPILSLGEHRPEGETAFDLDELAVTADARRFYLVSTRTGQIVEPLLPHAVDLQYGTQPMARLLCEISTGACRPCRPFFWGQAADEFAFLPRLRHGRIILSPARWTLTADQLPPPRASAPEWRAAFTALRAVRRVPDHVMAGVGDVVFGLDLTEPAHLAILRGQLRKAPLLTLTEASQDFGWIDGRPHEIVMPLARTTALRPPARPIRRHLTAATPPHLPGASIWLYAQLFAHPGRHNDLLTVHLPRLLSGWRDGPADDWWFIRDGQPQPHLRLRLRLHHPDRYGPAAAALAAWAAAPRETGVLRDLTLAAYQPETGRFGHGAALHAAETLFAADSAYTLALLGVGIDPAAATAAGHLGLVTGLLGTDGTRWLIDHIEHGGGPALDRSVLAQAHHLHRSPPADLTALAARRRRTLTAYRRHLDECDLDAAMTDLLHLHHTRMIGLDPDSERMCLRLARALAQRSRHQERSRPCGSTNGHVTPPTT
ncbi:lantibiotic dehydratase [Streptosporangium saharense]|uniref:lantibiotic dehydratase n=1 Tax=Streptosporangium saharense TaxID=1706840 RepID=UPI0036B9353C